MHNSSKVVAVVARDASQPKKLPFLLKTLVGEIYFSTTRRASLTNLILNKSHGAGLFRGVYDTNIL